MFELNGTHRVPTTLGDGSANDVRESMLQGCMSVKGCCVVVLSVIECCVVVFYAD